MSERWPPMLGIVGFDGGYKSAVALAIPPEGLVAEEGEFAVGPEGIGACCYDDGTCDDITEFDCASAGGTYQGDGTDCASVSCTGVCCEPGCVDDTTPDGCTLDGGTFQGFGTTCADDPPPCPPTGACCVDADCSIATEDGCTGMGGMYQGDDTTCDPNPCEVMPPCCEGAFEHDGHFYLHKEVNITGTCHCGDPLNNDGSVNATSIADIDPDTCEITYSCSGGGEQPFFGHHDWVLHLGQCWFRDPDGVFQTNDPLYTLRCFEFFPTCPSVILIEADDCTQSFSSGNCSASWTVTATYSQECTPPEGFFSDPFFQNN